MLTRATATTFNVHHQPTCPAALETRYDRQRSLLAVAIFSLLVLIAPMPSTNAGTLILQSSTWHSNPAVMGYNCGDFWAGSNIKDWWRYSGVSGVRMFINPDQIEGHDALPPWGDGVTDQSSFLSLKAALRADPLNTDYINWPSLISQYQNNDLGTSYGGNHITVNYALGELRKLNVQILAEISVGSTFPIGSDADWAGLWELWHHYYSQAFYLSRNFDVQRYQMRNEPNSSSSTLSQSDWLRDMKVVADAIQSAIADVNARYGKSLVPMLFAPVSSAASLDSWGTACVDDRHVNFLGVTDSSFLNMQKYDYHNYNDSPSTFGNNMSSIESGLSSRMSPESRFPVTISEFNVYNAATFDGRTDTLDTPANYATLGSIAVNLMKNYADEMYCFKFGQEPYSGTYPVNKNATHYMDPFNAPYNCGGITKAGEVWRLFNKGFPVGGSQLNYTRGSGMDSLDLRSGYDPATQRYYLFSANDASTNVTYAVDTTALNLPVGNTVLIEEVSENRYGGGRVWGSIAANKAVFDGSNTNLVQPGNTVWLFTFPVSQRAVQTIAASDDATVTDGANAAVNYGSATTLWVRNDPTDASQRSAALIKFPLTGINPSEIQMAVLQVKDWTPSGSLAQAHVYGLDNDAWSQTNVTWSNAPNLAQGTAAGIVITNRVILGQGDTAHILGQLVANSTSHAYRYIDVTAWLRSKLPGSASATFLLSQDPRWNVTLPSLDAGDTQADGITLGATEGGSGPQLLLIASGLRWNAGTGNWNTSTSNWVDSATPAGALAYAEGNAATFDDNAPGAGPFTVTLTASHTPLNVCVSNQAKAYTLAGSGIAGNGNLVKRGAGTLTLSGPNSYTGDTVVGQGTLAITTGGRISSLSDLTVASGATLTTSVSNTFGAVPLGAWTIAGTITGTASVQTLPASVTLSNGAMTGNAFASWGTFLANATTTTITANGGSNTISSGNFGLANPATFSTPLSNDTLNVSAALGAASANGGSVTKIGEGTVTLSGDSTYSGGTTIANGGGTLIITNPRGLGAGPIAIVKSSYSSGALQLALTGNNTITNTFAGFHSTTFSSAPKACIQNVSGTNKITSDLTVTAGGGNGMVMQSDAGFLELAGTMSAALTSRGIYLTGAGNGLVSGPVTDGAGFPFTLQKSGSGLWTLSGANTYSGVTTISAGVLSVSATTTLPGWDTSGLYSVASGATLAVGNAVMDADIATMLGTGNFAAGASFGFDTSAGNRTYTPVLADTSAGSLGLVKVGASTLTLSGVNTYSGTTTIKAGTLRVNGAIAGGAVTVTNGGALGGMGTLGGAVTVQSGGTLSPGASLGTLTINNNLTLAGNVFIELNKSVSPSNDLVVVSGTLTNAGAGTVTVTNLGLAALVAGDRFPLFNKPLLNGQTLAITPAPGSGLAWTNKLAVDGSIAVVSAVILPVPATNLAIVATGPASYRVSGLGGATRTYGLYASTNVAARMTNWWLIGTTNSDPGGVIQFLDTHATNKQRFYRFGQ